MVMLGQSDKSQASSILLNFDHHYHLTSYGKENGLGGLIDELIKLPLLLIVSWDISCVSKISL